MVKKIDLYPVFAFCLGVMVFLIYFDLNIINPAHYEWLMQKDTAWHFLGWHAFRYDEWHLPLGVVKNLNWPQGTSIVYTDSLPLFSIIFKAFSPLLPRHFQSVGIWFLLSWGLHGLFAYLVVHRLSGKKGPALAASILFMLLPSLYHRIGHENLIAQWVILWAIYAFFEQRSPKSEIHFFLIIALTMCIHAYLGFMVLFIWGTWWLKLMAGKKAEISWTRHFMSIGISLGTWTVLLIIVMWMVGYFVVSPDGTVTEGFGHYSMNLNALINPQNWSLFLPNRPFATSGQYEGFQYLGMGIVIMVVMSINLLIFKKQLNLKDCTPEYAWLWIPIVCCFFLSVSHVVTFDNHILFTYPLNRLIGPLTGVFRSSGRLFWLPVLIFVAFSAALIIRSISTKRAVYVFIFLIIVQVCDISPCLYYYFKSYFSNRWESSLTDPKWAVLSSKTQTVRFCESGYDLNVLYSFIDKGVPLGIKIDKMVMARYIPSKSTCNEADEGALLVFNKVENVILSKKNQKNLKFMDGIFFLPPPALRDENLPDAPVFPFTVQQHKEKNMLDLLKTCSNDCTVVMAVKDEASTNLPDDAAVFLEKRGGKIGTLGFRESYAGIMHNDVMVAEKIGQKHSVSLVENINGTEIIVKSAGYNQGNYADILVGERNLSMQTRGINLIIIDWRNKVLTKACFDTFLESSR